MPFRQPDLEPEPERARLAAVPGPAETVEGDGDRRAASGPPAEEEAEPALELAFEAGLVKVAVIGGVVGFVVVFALASAGLYFISAAGLPAALAGAVFVGAFGGLGSGAMMAASLHKPTPPRRS
jgi:hypothetical protein